jgi:flagellar biosynthetic protein FlhB
MGDKTEAPTARRMEDAREEGKVARSVELNSAVIILVASILLKGPGKQIVDQYKEMVQSSILVLPGLQFTGAWLKHWIIIQLERFALPMAILLLGLLLTGVVVTLAQTNFLWSSKRIGFKFEHINPINGFKRIFSSQGLIELGRALLKLALVGYVAYSYLSGKISEIIVLDQTGLAVGVSGFVDVASGLIMNVAEAYLVLAVVDYAFQRWRFMRSMRMTKEEVKEDFKRSEGDPFLRGRIRAQQRRLARNRMMSNVKKATVVITNPTHLAVAMEYKPENMNAPRVLAKGSYLQAQRIVEEARKHTIPVVQNIPLARAIYRNVDVDHEIPPDLYVAMAEVLAYVYRQRGKKLQPAVPAGM